MSNQYRLSKEELKLKLATLEQRYYLARQGLSLGSQWAASVTFIWFILIIFLVLILVRTGVVFLTGNHIVLIIVVGLIAFCFYFSMVFGRAMTIKAEIDKTKKQLEIVLGEEKQ